MSARTPKDCVGRAGVKLRGVLFAGSQEPQPEERELQQGPAKS